VKQVSNILYHAAAVCILFFYQINSLIDYVLSFHIKLYYIGIKTISLTLQ